MRVEYYKRCVGLASDATLQGGPLAAASSTPLALQPPHCFVHHWSRLAVDFA